MLGKVWSLEHEAEGESVAGEVGCVAAVEVNIVDIDTALDKELAVEIIAQACAGTIVYPCGCVGLCDRTADIAPPRIPPATSGDIACRDAGIDVRRADVGADIRCEWGFQQIEGKAEVNRTGIQRSSKFFRAIWKGGILYNACTGVIRAAGCKQHAEFDVPVHVVTKPEAQAGTFIDVSFCTVIKLQEFRVGKLGRQEKFPFICTCIEKLECLCVRADESDNNKHQADGNRWTGLLKSVFYHMHSMFVSVQWENDSISKEFTRVEFPRSDRASSGLWYELQSHFLWGHARVMLRDVYSAQFTQVVT